MDTNWFACDVGYVALEELAQLVAEKTDGWVVSVAIWYASFSWTYSTRVRWLGKDCLLKPKSIICDIEVLLIVRIEAEWILTRNQCHRISRTHTSRDFFSNSTLLVTTSVQNNRIPYIVETYTKTSHNSTSFTRNVPEIPTGFPSLDQSPAVLLHFFSFATSHMC